VYKNTATYLACIEGSTLDLNSFFLLLQIIFLEHFLYTCTLQIIFLEQQDKKRIQIQYSMILISTNFNHNHNSGTMEPTIVWFDLILEPWNQNIKTSKHTLLQSVNVTRDGWGFNVYKFTLPGTTHHQTMVWFDPAPAPADHGMV